jgi:hypothetical protein
MAANWLVTLPRVHEVEQRTGSGQLESQRVATATGFLPRMVTPTAKAAVEAVVAIMAERHQNLMEVSNANLWERIGPPRRSAPVRVRWSRHRGSELPDGAEIADRRWFDLTEVDQADVFELVPRPPIRAISRRSGSPPRGRCVARRDTPSRLPDRLGEQPVNSSPASLLAPPWLG